MKTFSWMWSLPLFLLAGAYGCQKAAGPSASKQYDIKGKVVAQSADKSSVTIDHEDIPGLMRGMKMEFTVADPKVLEGISPGDQVQGRLEVRSGGNVITSLQKR